MKEEIDRLFQHGHLKLPYLLRIVASAPKPVEQYTQISAEQGQTLVRAFGCPHFQFAIGQREHAVSLMALMEQYKYHYTNGLTTNKLLAKRTAGLKSPLKSNPIDIRAVEGGGTSSGRLRRMFRAGLASRGRS